MDAALLEPPDAVSAPSDQRRASWGVAQWLGALLFFCVAAVVQTWPLVLHLENSIIDVPDQPGDTGYYIWNLWWTQHALLELQNPYVTDLIHFPQGADLYLGGVLLISGILLIPLHLTTGNLILSANILGLAFFVFSGLSMYAVAFHVTHNRLAALASGFIFAFTPWTVMHFQGGEWNHSATWTIPLFVLFLLRFQETLRLREAVAAGICLAVMIYNWLEYGTDAALFVGLFMAYWSVIILRARDWQRLWALWRGLAVIAAVAFVLTSPLVIQTLRSIYSGSYFLGAGDEFYSGDLASYFTPSPVWGPGKLPGTPYGTHLPVSSIEGTAYLGIVPLTLAALSLIAVRRTPHRVIFWAIIFVTFATLALGPYLYVSGGKTASLFGASFSVPMPYQIYDELPVVGSRRFTGRLIIFGILALSVLAGVGLDALMSWLRQIEKRLVVRALVTVAAFSIVAAAAFIGADGYGAGFGSALIIAAVCGSLALMAIVLAQVVPLLWPARSPDSTYKPLAPLVAFLVLCLIVLEFWNPPVHLSELPQPAIFQTIRDEPGDFAVLDVPLGRQDGYFVAGDSNGWLATYYQWMHEKPVLGGYVPRAVDLGWIMEEPGLRYLACHCFDPYSPDDSNSGLARDDSNPDVIRSLFREHRIKYAVLHKLDIHRQGLFFVGEGELTAFDAYLREVAHFTPIYSDPILAVYRNRDLD